MDDRELLESAAKAAGIKIEWVSVRLDDHFDARIRNENPYWFNWPVWNPLTDDGDAMRLAINLGITGMLRRVEELLSAEEFAIDQYAATRRAIVRAAAAIATAKS